MSHPDDPNLDNQLNDVPLPPRFVERLRAALQPSDGELDQRLQAVVVPEMLTTVLAAIPADEVLATQLRDVSIPTTLAAKLRKIPYLVETRPRTQPVWRTVVQFVTAACLLVLVAVNYAYVSRLWFAESLAAFIPNKPSELYLAYDGPLEITATRRGTERPSDDMLVSVDVSVQSHPGNVVHDPSMPGESFLGEGAFDIAPPFPELPAASRTSQMVALLQNKNHLLQNLAILRWGVLGARHDDRDEILQLEELPAPILKGIEPPLSKGYNRAFWLKHHVLPPLSPSVAELQSFDLPLRADVAGYDRVERLVAAGRKVAERDVRVEDFIAHALGSLPAAPSNTVQLRGIAGPSPFGAANTGLLQVLVQAGQFRVLQSRHWIIAVDLSASMQRGDRWQGVQRLLAAFPDRLAPEDRLSLVGFREEADVALEALGPEDFQLWRETIRRLQPAGGADLFVGVREAVSRALNEEGPAIPPAEIVIISDHEGLLTNTAVQGLSEMLRDAQRAGSSVQLVDLSAAANRSPLQQIAEASEITRHGAQVGSEPSSALRRWWSAVTPRVAADVQVQVKFDPKTVSAYRLVGQAAGSWSHVSSLVEPIDLSPGDAANGLLELALLPGTVGNVAEVQLRWRSPQTGETYRQSVVVPRQEFNRALHETPAFFQRAIVAAELAEVLNGSRTALREANWSAGEPHDLNTVLNTLRQLSSPVRLDPAAVQLLQLIESLRRQGIK